MIEFFRANPVLHRAWMLLLLILAPILFPMFLVVQNWQAIKDEVAEMLEFVMRGPK